MISLNSQDQDAVKKHSGDAVIHTMWKLVVICWLCSWYVGNGMVIQGLRIVPEHPYILMLMFIPYDVIY